MKSPKEVVFLILDNTISYRFIFYSLESLTCTKSFNVLKIGTLYDKKKKKISITICNPYNPLKIRVFIKHIFENQVITILTF